MRPIRVTFDPQLKYSVNVKRKLTKYMQHLVYVVMWGSREGNNSFVNLLKFPAYYIK